MSASLSAYVVFIWLQIYFEHFGQGIKLQGLRCIFFGYFYMIPAGLGVGQNTAFEYLQNFYLMKWGAEQLSYFILFQISLTKILGIEAFWEHGAG